MRNQIRGSSQNNSSSSSSSLLLSNSFQCLSVEGSSGDDFISRMIDDILVMILSLLPTKDAVVTSSLSTRWRFLWCNLNDLKFDDVSMGGYLFQSFPCFSARSTINVFRFYHKLDAIGLPKIYNLPSHLSSNATVVSLKRIVLKQVNVSDAILEQFLRNSPHLETISIQGSRDLKHIRVGGRALNLKHFEIVKCHLVESIYLSDFDLVSFSFNGGLQIDLRLCNLPKLMKFEISQRNMGLGDYVFNQISPCASSLVVLSLKGFNKIKEKVNINCLPKLPNVKTLSLAVIAPANDSLLELNSIAEACPNMESFTITLLYSMGPVIKREARHVASDRPHEHLKFFQIEGYYGQEREFELVAYMMNNAVALEKIVIDPRLQGWEEGRAHPTCFLRRDEVARSLAKQQLNSMILPQGLELVIL